MSFQDNLASEAGLYTNIATFLGFPPETMGEADGLRAALSKCMDALKTHPDLRSDRIFDALAAVALNDPLKDISASSEPDFNSPHQVLGLYVVEALSELAAVVPDDIRPAEALNLLTMQSFNMSICREAAEALCLKFQKVAAPGLQAVLGMAEHQARHNTNIAVRRHIRQCLHSVSEQNPAALDFALHALEMGMVHDKDPEARKEACETLKDKVLITPRLDRDQLQEIFSAFTEAGGQEICDIIADGKAATIHRLMPLMTAKPA